MAKVLEEDVTAKVLEEDITAKPFVKKNKELFVVLFSKKNFVGFF
jgi:hypothetical protein